MLVLIELPYDVAQLLHVRSRGSQSVRKEEVWKRKRQNV